MDDTGVEDAAILLMSLGEEEAAEVFKHLAPKEVQRLGETIARMKAVSRDRLEGVIDRFVTLAASESMLVADTDEYVKAVLRKALGEDKANLLIDRILQVAADLCRDGMAILLVEQIVEKALRHAHRCYLMDTGRIVG